jgi:hypothetical protein
MSNRSFYSSCSHSSKENSVSCRIYTVDFLLPCMVWIRHLYLLQSWGKVLFCGLKSLAALRAKIMQNAHVKKIQLKLDLNSEESLPH